MALVVTALPSIVIVSGSSNGNAVASIDDAFAITIFSPSALTNTITVDVEPSTTGSSFVTLQSGGSDVAIPAGKATLLSPSGFRQLRLVASGSEAASRTFSLTKSFLV